MSVSCVSACVTRISVTVDSRHLHAVPVPFQSIRAGIFFAYGRASRTRARTALRWSPCSLPHARAAPPKEDGLGRQRDEACRGHRCLRLDAVEFDGV